MGFVSHGHHRMLSIMQSITLIRHGYQISWDQQLKVRGSPPHQRLDPALAEIGVQQAELTAVQVKASGGAIQVVSSPFRRCLETADRIAAACDCPVVPDWRVGEVLLSQVLGSPFSPNGSMDPEWESRREGAGKPAHPESDVTLAQRIAKMVAEWKALKPFPQRLVVVSHEIILKELFNAMTGKTVVVDWHPCGMTTLVRDKPMDRHWRLQGLMAGWKHLGAADRVEPTTEIKQSYHPLDSRS